MDMKSEEINTDVPDLLPIETFYNHNQFIQDDADNIQQMYVYAEPQNTVNEQNFVQPAVIEVNTFYVYKLLLKLLF